MKVPANTKLEPVFFCNYFCLMPNTNLAFVAISKNGVTFLKNVAIFSEKKYWPRTFNESHNIIGYNSQSPYLVPVKDMPAYEEKNGKLIKFAIWRDPVERIESTYKLYCLEKEYRAYFRSLGLYEENSFERFMEFVRFEWGKKDPLYQDEHIRGQADYYHESDVDHIVHIGKMHQFLQMNKVQFVKEQSNQTKASFKISEKEVINEIQEHYKADYEIKCTF